MKSDLNAFRCLLYNILLPPCAVAWLFLWFWWIPPLGFWGAAFLGVLSGALNAALGCWGLWWLGCEAVRFIGQRVRQDDHQGV